MADDTDLSTEILRPGPDRVAIRRGVDRVRLSWTAEAVSPRTRMGLMLGVATPLVTFGALGMVPLVFSLIEPGSFSAVWSIMAAAVAMLGTGAATGWFASRRPSHELVLTASGVRLDGDELGLGGERPTLTLLIHDRGGWGTASRETVSTLAKELTVQQHSPSPGTVVATARPRVVPCGLNLKLGGRSVPLARWLTPGQAITLADALERNWPEAPEPPALPDAQQDADREALERLRRTKDPLTR